MTDPQALIGTQVGPYQIQKHIARGGMADVFLAYEEGLQRKAALKIMLPTLAADEQFVQRFQREARAVAKLDHPNIVHVYRIGETSTGQPYIAMQYVEGGALRDTLLKTAQRGELIERNQALSIIGKMADALQFAHSAGIIHRDIKPSNILIRGDGRPVLVDLGIAAVSGSQKLTQTGTLIGTPHYMSPEQARGLAVDGRSDLYSLGVILYEMLAGRRPFEATDPIAILHSHVYEQPEPLARLRPDLPPETIAVVETAMQKEPNKRFQTAGEMHWAINTALKAQGGPGVITSAGLWEPHPTSQYRLSESKIVTADPTTLDQPTKKSARRYGLILIPLLIIALLIAAWQFLPALTITSTPPQTNPDTQTTAQPTENLVFAVQTPTENSAETIASGNLTPTDSEPAEIITTAAPSATNTLPPAPTDTPIPSPSPDRGPETITIGRSVQGKSIEAVRLGGGSNVIIFIGGLHAGFAPATVSLAQNALDYFTDNPERIPETAMLYIVPNANPDSPNAPGELNGRLNANQVDLNRNWDCRWDRDAKWRGNVVNGSGGAAPFSEPETQGLRDFIISLNPRAVVFWEARATNGLSAAGACQDGPKVSQPVAFTYGIAAGYPVEDFESLTNQELNGDGSNWLDDQGVPAIAILLPEYTSMDWNNNLAGMLATLDTYGR